METFFIPYREGACCLCGSTERLTGEHKIKASAIKGEFGSTPMEIRDLTGQDDSIKSAQGPKSKAFHFEARLCTECNGARTQSADHEFDYFLSLTRDLLTRGARPESAWNDHRYANNSKHYIDLHRYFAKLLCCHLASMRGPCPKRMVDFVLGDTDENCVSIEVDYCYDYHRVKTSVEAHKYAAHGGLVIYCNKINNNVTAFHSHVSIGPLQYTFWSRLLQQEQLELKNLYTDFYGECYKIMLNERHNPMPDEDWIRLGICPPDRGNHGRR